MAEVSGTTKTVGRIGGLLLFLGVIVFFSGIAGFPRLLVLVGVGMIVTAFILFWVEEIGHRKLERTNWR